MFFGLFTTQHERNVMFKRVQRADRIADLNEYREPLTSKERIILGTPAIDAVAMLKKEEWTPFEVLKAYGKKALECHKETNALTEIMIREAEERARNTDLTTPLAGFPVSLKDSYGIDGFDATMALSRLAGIGSSDTPFTKLILEAGGNPFVKTNVPWQMFSFDTHNDLWGATQNPHVKGYTCGGSSGGEAALLAWGGSRLGTGSDIAGSVRNPAHWSGCFSLRMTATRYPKGEWPNPCPGYESIVPVSSPMCRTMSDLRFYTDVIMNSNPAKYDSNCIPLPWREVPSKKLKVAVMWNDGIVRPVPACSRALKTPVEAIKASGHEVVDFECPNMLEIMQAYSNLFTDAFLSCEKNAIFGEYIDSTIKRMLQICRWPQWLRWPYIWWVRYVRKDPIWADLVTELGPHSALSLQYWTDKRDKASADFIGAFERSGADVLLCVPAQTVATPIGYKDLDLVTGPTFMFNLLNMPAGIIPVTHLDKDIDTVSPDFKVANGVEQAAYDIYDPVSMHGLPAGIQIVGRRYQDEEVLKAMEQIQEALEKADKAYPLIGVE